jgi:hypothetical protein
MEEIVTLRIVEIINKIDKFKYNITIISLIEVLCHFVFQCFNDSYSETIKLCLFTA